jgi:pimeloyl-ACP methyl ester carboxylesterase
MPTLRSVFFAALVPMIAGLGSVQAAPKVKVDPAFKMIPTSISGTYSHGQLIELRFHDRIAYVVKPTGKVDPQRRWVWIYPFWLEINDGNGRLQHRFYAEKILEAGFHIAGINVGTSCGSPSAARLNQEFYEFLVGKYQLNHRARLIVQSNGGLIGYSWAFRHPQEVDRVAGICPVTDFRTWPPAFSNLVTAPDKGLGYDLTLEQITKRMHEFNPIDNLAPLAQAGVKILQIHGDKDTLVPTDANSFELQRRYQKLGGAAEIVVLKGLGHGGTPLYESKPLINFVLAD